VARRGVMGAMLRPKPSPLNACRKHLPDRKKGAKFDRTSRLSSLLFDCEGVVYHTFVPRGHTVNKEFYLEVLQSLREAGRKKKV
jgi:hypothetical protein